MVVNINSQETALRAILKSEICSQHQMYASLQYVSSAHADWLLSYTVYLAAVPCKSRLANTFYGTVVQLTHNSFCTIVNLCLVAYLADHFQLSGYTSRWVHSDDLWLENTARYIHRTNEELRAGGVTSELITNDKRGSYSILLPSEDMIFHLDRLSDYDDVLVSKPAHILKEIIPSA